MAARRNIRNFDIYWYGPGGHESHRKVGGLKVLPMHIGRALRKAKAETDPLIHEIQIGFREETGGPEIYARHPKTNWLHWAMDYRELERLEPSKGNAAIGEFSIEIVEKLRNFIVETPNLVRKFPITAIDEAIGHFRAADYSYTAPLSPIKSFDASPLTARFLTEGNCIETKVTMIFLLGGEELHRSEITRMKAGSFASAKYTTAFDLYDNEIKFFSLNPIEPSPVLRYADLPECVHEHLPSNEQLHLEWGTPYNRK